MRRLPVNLFKEVYGEEMQYRFSSALKEREVEAAYTQFYFKSSRAKIFTIPRCIPAILKWKATEMDGLMECTYGKETFYFSQETKWHYSSTRLGLMKQLVQPLMYKWLLQQHKADPGIMGVIVNSEAYIGYVFYSEIEDFISELWEVFPQIKENPCKAYSNPLVRGLIDKYEDVNFHLSSIENKYALHNTLRDIYKHCLTR